MKLPIKVNRYCPKCNELTEIKVQVIDEVFDVKGEKINIKSEVVVCIKCDEKVFNQELDDRNLSLAYSIYRKKHNLLSPTEITNIRQKYLLSQRSLSRLLEWGEITINRYDSGAIQDSAHNEVLRFIIEPKNMKEFYEKNSQFLTKPVIEKLKKR